MAGQLEMRPRNSAEFVESSILEAVVPSYSECDLQDEIESWDGSNEDENTSVLPFLAQRQFLLFDELVPVYIVFRTPFMEDITLKSYLGRLAINVEAVAFSTAPPSSETETKGPPPKEVIFSETIKESTLPTVVYHEDEDGSHIYAIWKIRAFISRPRGRYYKPAIYFQPTASLKPAEKASRSVPGDDYLPSRVPTALNLLQSFENDPALTDIHPRLSALRINKIAPTAPVSKELVRPIRNGQRRLFRALPALIWRMRYSKVQASLSDTSLMASLELEVAYMTGYPITIDDVRLSLRGGHVKCISDNGGVPRTHKPGDQLVYLYKITPNVAPDGSLFFGPESYFMTLDIKANVLASAECRPVVTINWQTAVDFLAEQNTGLVKVAHRLSNPALQLPNESELDSLSTHDDGQRAENYQNKVVNITLTISGPSHVTVGETFHWKIFIVNRSDKARKLAVLVIPRRKRDYEKHKQQSSTSSLEKHRADRKGLIASAVLDENIVYAKQKSARTEAADLLCLTTDVRVGHLASGASYTADLKFLALSAGVLSIDAVRVVDLATNETSDIRDVPTIVAVAHEADAEAK